MKKTILFFILIIISLPGFCQIIYGTIYDENTKKQVPNAYVFLNGSTVGTIADESGNFKILLPDSQKLPIAVTSIGYTSILVTDYPSDIPLQIFLSPKIYTLDEVRVYSKMSARDRKKRKQNINMFKEQFLGTSLYARSCEILNENDLVLQYSEFEDTLRVYSHKPLIINNKALGYQILFFMDKFEYSPKLFTLTYIGNYVFKEDQTLKGLKWRAVEKKRRLAYLGSRMQFFRSLWENSLDSDGFIIRNVSNQDLTYDSLIVQTDHIDKYLKYKGTAKIYYYSKSIKTTIQLQKDSVYFDKLGYYDPFGINWWRYGEMTNQRMGDQLPFDYKYK